MGVRQTSRVPKDIFLPAARRMRTEEPGDPDKWTDYQCAKVREWCGPQYAGIPLEEIRIQGGLARKNGWLGRQTANGHGATKRVSWKRSPEYIAHLKSDAWKRFAETVRAFWGYRCAMCHSDRPLDVHHRTYLRLGKELPTDCIAICRECHKVADRRRQREATMTSEDLLHVFDCWDE